MLPQNKQQLKYTYKNRHNIEFLSVTKNAWNFQK